MFVIAVVVGAPAVMVDAVAIAVAIAVGVRKTNPGADINGMLQCMLLW